MVSVGIEGVEEWDPTYIFDVRAGMDGDDIAVLDAEVVADDSVQAGAAVVELLVGQDDEHSIFPLLATDEDGVAAEEIELLHRVLGQGNDGVVIVDGIRHHQLVVLLLLLEDGGGNIVLLADLGA